MKKKEAGISKLNLILLVLLIIAIIVIIVMSVIKISLTGKAVWHTYRNGDLKVSEPYRQAQFLITEVEMSPKLVKEIKTANAAAQVADLVASAATFDYESVKQAYNKNWGYFDIVKWIKELKKTDVVTSVLAKATNYFSKSVSESCLNQIAQKKPADRDGWVRFKIKTWIEGKKNSRLYPDWVYMYVNHDWGGYCSESTCYGSIHSKTGQESNSCFG